MVSISWIRKTFSIAGALALCFVLAGVALAHEHREVGPYEIVVGWTTEPAFVGEKNGLDLRVSRHDTQEPVEGLEQTLQAEIIFGGEKRTLELRPVFRQPGRYTADVVPTREGDYRFHIFGTIEDLQIDETFDSADRRFNGVQPVTTIQFPDTLPSTSEIAQTSGMLEQRVSEAQSAADSSRTLALVAAVLGGLGLLLGGLAYVSSSRAARAASGPAPDVQPGKR
ncbi:MAG: hypothetical protein KatS3mg057_1202 [Herpetosiphonaceae bacterium]|nr:MAG: hypothetical protein KatS3mg057_1202 [Herpetosiphonaceae bacterium]